MLNFIRGIGTGTSIVLVIVFALFMLLLAPMLFLWSVNTLAEVAGTKFYIPHTFWSYLASFVLLLVAGTRSE